MELIKSPALSSESALPAASNSTFYLQYLTLMLIVVVFMLGSFVRKALTDIATHKQQEVQPPLQLPIEESPVTANDEFALRGVFHGEEITAVFDGLASMIHSHDIRLEITVYPPADSASALSESHARALRLTQLVSERSAPTGSIIVQAAGGPASDDVTVRLFSLAER